MDSKMRVSEGSVERRLSTLGKHLVGGHYDDCTATTSSSDPIPPMASQGADDRTISPSPTSGGVAGGSVFGHVAQAPEDSILGVMLSSDGVLLFVFVDLRSRGFRRLVVYFSDNLRMSGLLSFSGCQAAVVFFF